VMLKFERLIAFGAFKFPQEGWFIMWYHMALQTIYISECLVTQSTALCVRKWEKDGKIIKKISYIFSTPGRKREPAVKNLSFLT
jgi:hypothetical protein